MGPMVSSTFGTYYIVLPWISCMKLTISAFHSSELPSGSKSVVCGKWTASEWLMNLQPLSVAWGAGLF